MLEKKEESQDLCEQAAVEQNPEKLLELTKQINRLLEEKERRVAQARKQVAKKNRFPTGDVEKRFSPDTDPTGDG